MKKKNSKISKSLNENSNYSIYIDTEIQDDIGHAQLLKEYKKAVDQSTIVSITDKNGVITYVNDAFVQVSGYSKDELMGKNDFDFFPEDEAEFFIEKDREVLKTGSLLDKKPWHSIIKNRAKDGSAYYVDTTITPILSRNGDIEKFIAIRHDITKVYEQEQLINKQLKDTLTGLPNRLQLLQDLEKKEHSALTIFDIDAFQEVNKLYGQTVGDDILKSVSAYLVEALSKENKQKKIYKLPGDVFVILCNDACDEDACKHIIAPLLHQFSENLFQVGEHEIYMNMTAGVSYGNDVDILVNANIALNNAKKLKLPYAFYNLHPKNRTQYQKRIPTRSTNQLEL